MALHLHVIDERPVGAAQIAYAPACVIAGECAVPARDRPIGDADGVLGVAADCNLVAVERKDVASEDAADDDKLRSDGVLHATNRGNLPQRTPRRAARASES